MKKINNQNYKELEKRIAEIEKTLNDMRVVSVPPNVLEIMATNSTIEALKMWQCSCGAWVNFYSNHVHVTS